MYSLVYSLVYSFLREMYTLYTLGIYTLFLLNKRDRYTNASTCVYRIKYTFYTSTDRNYTSNPTSIWYFGDI